MNRKDAETDLWAYDDEDAEEVRFVVHVCMEC